MVYLDTHIVVWLYAGLVEKFTPLASDLINEHEVIISPIVRLELQYLYEIQRVSDDALTIIADLTRRIALKVCDKHFDAIIGEALSHAWTRDPFDRLIVANASLNNTLLITKDHNMRDHYPFAKW